MKGKVLGFAWAIIPAVVVVAVIIAAIVGLGMALGYGWQRGVMLAMGGAG